MKPWTREQAREEYAKLTPAERQTVANGVRRMVLAEPADWRWQMRLEVLDGLK